MALQTTPGGRRRARAEEAYVPFNPKPRDVGTRTGQPMPKDVPRTIDGFEDPDAFFKSPNTTAPNTIARTPGMSSRTGPSANTRKGRLSALGGDDSGDEGFEEDLLVDEDELDAALATPSSYFPRANPPPSVTLPRRSQIAPASPSVEFDALPSPRRRKSTIGVNLNPTPASGRSTNKTTHSPPADNMSPAPDDMDHGGDELDEAMVSQSVPRSNKKRRVTNGNRVEDGDGDGDGDEVEMRRNAHRSSVASRKSVNGVVDPEADTDDEMPSEAGGPSFRFDGEIDGMDQDDGDVQGDGEQGADEDDDAGREEAGVAEEDEGTEDEAPNEPERHPRPTAKARRKNVDPPPARVAAKKRKTRLSRLDNEDVDGVHGDFVSRRSGRQHFKPLAYWRGEKFEYQRGNYLPVIKEVVHIPEEHIEPFAARNKRSRTGRSESVRPTNGHANGHTNGHGGTHEPEEAGWDDGTDPIGLVKEFPSGRETHRRIAYPRSRLEPKVVKGGDFKYQKVFGEDQFIAAGVVYVPVGNSKTGKETKDNSYVFYVIAGAVQVHIHRTSFVMAPGAMFLVPRGNNYSISNVSPTTEAELFFAQARKIRTNEEEDVVIAAASKDPADHLEEGSAKSARRATSALPPVEEEEESDEQPAKRRKSGAGRRKK